MVPCPLGQLFLWKQGIINKSTNSANGAALSSSRTCLGPNIENAGLKIATVRGGVISLPASNSNSLKTHVKGDTRQHHQQQEGASEGPNSKSSLHTSQHSAAHAVSYACKSQHWLLFPLYMDNQKMSWLLCAKFNKMRSFLL